MSTRDTILAVVSVLVLAASSEDLSLKVSHLSSWIETPLLIASFVMIVYLFVRNGYSSSAKNSIFR